jgi:hypothetical protein
MMIRSRCWGVKLIASMTLVWTSYPSSSCKGLHDHGKRASLVMRSEILDVFEHERRRALFVNDPGHVEKQSALGGVFEPMEAAEGILFAYPGDGKRLARETAQQNVMVRDFLGRERLDVTDERVGVFLVIREVGQVRFFGVLVPLAGEDAAATMRLEALPDAADAGKEIDELEIVRSRNGPQGPAVPSERVRAWWGRRSSPLSQRATVRSEDVELLRELPLCVTGASQS